MKRKGRVALVVVALASVVALTLAALGSGASSKAAAGSIKVTPRTIGVLDIVRSSPIEQVTEKAINTAAHQLGWKVIAVDAKGDPQISAQAIQSFVNQHVDGIIALTVEASTIRAGLMQAKQDGIVTCQATGQTTPSPLWTAQYEEDEAKLARTLAQYIVKTQPNPKVAYLKQSLNLVGARRGQAVKQVFGGVPSAKIVATAEPSLGDPGTAQKVVADILNAHPDVNAVYATMDAWGLPANSAIRAARANAKVYSFYTSPSNVAALRGKTAYAAVVDDNIQKTALVCLDQFLQHFQNKKAMDPKALVKWGDLTYEIVSRADVNRKVKPGATGAFTNAHELAPFLKKWRAEFK